MWDPDAFARDDELLSWRSFDTTLGAEAEDTETLVNVVSETNSGACVCLLCLSPRDNCLRLTCASYNAMTCVFYADASDGDDLAELIDRSHADVHRLSRYGAPGPSASEEGRPAQRVSAGDNNRAIEPNWQFVADPVEIAPFRMSDAVGGNPTITLRIERAKESMPVVLKELPSTSEMVSITHNPDRGGSERRGQCRVSEQMSSRRQDVVESPDQTSSRLAHDNTVLQGEEYSQPAADFSNHFHQPQMRMLDQQPLYSPSELLKEDMSIRHPSLSTISLYGRDVFECAQEQEQQQQMCPLAHDFEFQSRQLQQRQPMSLSQLLAQSRVSQEVLSSHPVVDHSQKSHSRQELHIQQLEAELEEKNAQVRY